LTSTHSRPDGNAPLREHGFRALRYKVFPKARRPLWRRPWRGIGQPFALTESRTVIATIQAALGVERIGRLDAGVEFLEADAPTEPGLEAIRQPPRCLHDLPPLHPSVRWIDDEAEPGESRPDGHRLGFILVQGESQPGEEVDNRPLPAPQLGLGVREQRHVVHVADVGPAAQRAFDELIQRMEVAVGPELRCEIADRQASGACGG
jgi:hypothetical protein